MAGRALQVAAVLVTLVVAALAMGMVAGGFADMPECGTGSYFLSPMGP